MKLDFQDQKIDSSSFVVIGEGMVTAPTAPVNFSLYRITFYN